jgi:hypothetical protein
MNVVKSENFPVFVLGIYTKYAHKCYCIEQVSKSNQMTSHTLKLNTCKRKY